eukprot:g5639.t1
MVNVEVTSPSLLLGVAMILSGASLFAVRKSNIRISRDSDVIVSSLIIVTGGALVFQGWRLDPLMLLCQIMTCGVACTFAYEAFAQREQETFNDLRSPTRPPEQSQQSEDEFFYDFDEVDPQDPANSELPEPRSSMDDFLDEEEEGNWTVIGGAESPADDFSLWNDNKPRSKTQGRNSKRRNKGNETLQTIEDWE